MEVTMITALYIAYSFFKEVCTIALRIAGLVLCFGAISSIHTSINAMDTDTTPQMDTDAAQEQIAPQIQKLFAFTHNGTGFISTDGWNEDSDKLHDIAHCARASFYDDKLAFPTIEESKLDPADIARLSQSRPSLSLTRTAHYTVKYRNTADEMDQTSTRVTITPLEDPSKEFVYDLPNSAPINSNSCVAATELEPGNLLIAYNSQGAQENEYLNFIDVKHKRDASMSIPGAHQLSFSSQEGNGTAWLTIGTLLDDDTFSTHIVRIGRNGADQALKILATRRLPDLDNTHGGGTGWSCDGNYLLVAKRNAQGTCKIKSYSPPADKFIAKSPMGDIQLPQDQLHFPLDLTADKAHAIINNDVMHTTRPFIIAHAIDQLQPQTNERQKNLTRAVFAREIGQKR